MSCIQRFMYTVLLDLNMTKMCDACGITGEYWTELISTRVHYGEQYMMCYLCNSVIEHLSKGESQ